MLFLPIRLNNQTLISLLLGFKIEMLLPHGYCINWSPALLWINVISNAIVAIAYFSIPLALGYIAYKRRDFNFRPALILFSAFIISCGLTHIMAIIMIWKPIYVIDNAMMALTAVLSLGTALYLLPQITNIINIPSASQLTDLNSRLHAEIDRQKELEKDLSEQESLYRALAENSPDLIVRYDKDGRRLYVNQAYEMVTGIPPEALIGKSILEHSVLSGRTAKYVLNNILEVFATGRETSYEVSFEIKGRTLHYHYRCIPELDENNQVHSVLAVGRDVTAYKEMEAQLQTLATTDALTGISNRRSFMEKLAAELSVVKRYKTSAFLLLLDLDHFKKINDVYGHAGGDGALKYFSRLIQSSLRNTDVFARIGGEEFAIVLHATSFEVAQDIADKLRKLVEVAELEYQGQGMKLSVSIGMTNLDAKDADLTIPLLRADKALYAAKEDGRNRVNANFKSEA